jgi:D-glycero-alpha-D-manno-heptose-7-phosphate kinase
MTINRYAYVTVEPREDQTIEAHSYDYGASLSYNVGNEPSFDGKIDLLKATTKRLGVATGVTAFSHCDAPPGSGLGASSAMVAAYVGALSSLLHIPLTYYDIAALSVQIERKDLGIAGGYQDQYACTFGGWNYIEFFKDAVVVNPLRIPAETLNELEYSVILVFTGGVHYSAGIIQDQVERYVKGESDSLSALHEIKQLASDMKKALLLGDIQEVGYLLDVGWEQKKRLSPRISNPTIDALYEEAKKAGAVGGKLLGAGGGGYLALVCSINRRHRVVEALQKAGGRIDPWKLEPNGLQTWEARGWNS